MCASTGHQHVEQKAPGQPGDMRPQGPRARPDGSEQALLRVQPTWGDLHRYHRGLLRMHLMLWNAVSNNTKLHMSRISLVAYYSPNSGKHVATMQRCQCELEISACVYIQDSR